MAASTPVSLLMMDLDHFKAFNDRHGHQAGDTRLQQVAASCVTQLAPAATAARYGGEEFCVVLPRTDLAAGTALADALRTAIAALSDTGAANVQTAWPRRPASVWQRRSRRRAAAWMT